jgi:hypothetical protein
MAAFFVFTTVQHSRKQMMLYYLTAKSAKGREKLRGKALCFPGVYFVFQDVPSAPRRSD